MGLLAEMVIEPSFDQAEFDRYKAQQLATIQQRQMDPGSLAADEAARFIYAAGQPYARPMSGRAEVVAELGTADARRFAEQRYGPSAMVIVGDVDVAEAVAEADRAFGAWSTSLDPVPAAGVEPAAQGRRVHVELDDC